MLDRLLGAYHASCYGARYLYYKKCGYFDVIKSIILSFIYIKYNRSDGVGFYKSSRLKARPDLIAMEDAYQNDICSKDFVLTPKRRVNFCWPFFLIIYAYFFFRWRDKYVVSPVGVKGVAACFFYGLHCFSSALRNKYEVRFAYVFCDCVGVDATFASMHKLSGAHVVCIQHGQYRYQPDVTNSDLLPFNNNCGDEILVWGRATLHEYERAGLDRYVVNISGRYGYERSDFRFTIEELRFVCIALNGPDSSYVNKSLIEFAECVAADLGVGIKIKRHPADKENYLHDDFKDGDAFFSFYICYSSGFIIDSMMCGRPIAIYKDGRLPDVYKSLPFCISTVEEACSLARNRSIAFWGDLYSDFVGEFVKNA